MQTEYGGTFERRDAPEALVASAAAILRSAPTEAGRLYARVDGCAGPSGGLVLMELELIEPLLFLAEDADAPARLARRIAELLANRA